MCEEPEAQTQPCPTQLEKGTALLHAMAPQEVHTPNAVICVQGTTVLIRFTTPPDTTEVISLMGTVTVWNQQGVRAKVTLAANSRALVIGNRQPVKTPDFPFPRPPVKVAPDPGVGCNPQTCGPTVDHPLRNTALEAIIHIPR